MFDSLILSLDEEPDPRAVDKESNHRRNAHHQEKQQNNNNKTQEVIDLKLNPTHTDSEQKHEQCVPHPKGDKADW